jgi:hypothetical protein
MRCRPRASKLGRLALVNPLGAGATLLTAARASAADVARDLAAEKEKARRANA